MESRKLAALLPSLISQLLLLILLLFPPGSNSNSSANAFPFIHHSLFSQEIAVCLSLASISRKRKRYNTPDPEPERVDDDGREEDPRGFGPVARSPDSFKNCFKMTSSTFEWLAGLLEPLLECRDPADLFPLNLSAGLRLGIGLFRLANGSNYPEISKRFGVSEAVARFCVKQLCRVLCTNYRFWVAFPNPYELESVSQGFEGLSGLPNCCGVIDCTRFKVVNSETSCEECIAAQIVVDSSCRILSIVVGFHGHKSNLRILKSSTLYKDIEGGTLLNSPPIYVNGVAMNQYLIGDVGYPLLPWLMVPVVETLPGSFEENFNEAHNLMRLPALRTVASLKNWGVLSQPIREELKMAVACIGACSILHNSLLMREDFSALSSGLEDYQSQHQSHRDYKLEDNSITRRALVIRSTLATIAKRSHSSIS